MTSGWGIGLAPGRNSIANLQPVLHCRACCDMAIQRRVKQTSMRGRLEWRGGKATPAWQDHGLQRTQVAECAREPDALPSRFALPIALAFHCFYSVRTEGGSSQWVITFVILARGRLLQDVTNEWFQRSKTNTRVAGRTLRLLNAARHLPCAYCGLYSVTAWSFLSRAAETARKRPPFQFF